MKRYITTTIYVCLLAVLITGLASADVLIGAPGGSGNCFPFGCNVGGSNTVYQQVYAASEFSGPVTISGIEFFQTLVPGGDFNVGTFDISLSTTSKPVDGLDTATFASNIGPDNQAFAMVTLLGGPASGLTISGTPFSYDPAGGNLLINMDISLTSGGSSYLDARNGDAGGVFSRAHDFGSGYEGFGLVTNFITGTAAVPEPSTLCLVASGALIGLALARRKRA